MKNELRRRVEIRAYEIWQREGCPNDKSTQHWLQAVAEVSRDDAEAAAAKLNMDRPRQKTEKPKPVPRAKTTASASASKRRSQDSGKKPRAKPKTESGRKTKKAAE